MQKLLYILLLGSLSPLFVFASFDTNLKLGSKGEEVKKVQTFLIQQNHLASTTSLGFYGNQTKNGVIKFQVFNNLTPTGNWMSLTRNKANSFISNSVSSITNKQNLIASASPLVDIYVPCDSTKCGARAVLGTRVVNIHSNNKKTEVKEAGLPTSPDQATINEASKLLLAKYPQIPNTPVEVVQKQINNEYLQNIKNNLVLPEIKLNLNLRNFDLDKFKDDKKLIISDLNLTGQSKCNCMGIVSLVFEEGESLFGFTEKETRFGIISDAQGIVNKTVSLTFQGNDALVLKPGMVKFHYDFKIINNASGDVYPIVKSNSVTLIIPNSI